MIEKIVRFPIPQNVKTVLWHLGLWALVIGVPFIFDSSTGSAIELREQMKEQLQADIEIQGIAQLDRLSYLVLVVFFYINYSLLIPKIFYPKGLKWYIGALIIDYFFFTATMLLIIHFLAIKFIPPFPVFIVLFIIINAISLAIRVTATRIKEERNKQSRENETLKSELSFLRSQISPHFLFNIMNSIVSMSRLKPELVEPTLIQLSQLMRYMLYESDENKVSIDKEIAYLESYISLQKMRFGKSVNVVVEKNEVAENAQNGVYTEGSSLTIEPMLLIPFVENAFKHGVGMIREPMIHVQIFTQRNQLIFNVLNKFNAQTDEQKDFDSGIGLKNVARRLALVYGQNHTLKATAEGDVFVVNLTINLKE